VWAINSSGKNEDSKIFIISLGSKRWGRFQSSGMAMDD